MPRQSKVRPPGAWISVPAAAARKGPRRVYTLPVEHVHPSIRVAHQWEARVKIPERIIFDYELVLFLRGEGAFVIEGRHHDIRPHRLFVVRPYQPHSIFSSPEATCEHIAVHFDLKPGFPALARHVTRRPPYEVRLSGGVVLPTCVTLGPGHIVERCLTELVRIRRHASPTAMLEATTLLQRALTFLLRAGGDGEGRRVPAKPDGLQRAVAYARAHFRDRVALADLARAAGLSPAQVSRRFVAWTGLTPAAYVRQVRVEQARRLLGQADRPIKEIAAACGFKSPCHFARVFRSLEGRSPAHHRASLGALPDPGR